MAVRGGNREFVVGEAGDVAARMRQKARLLELGVVPGGESSAQFAGYVKAEVAKWRQGITEAKVPPIGG